MADKLFLGIDTSNYTTSFAVVNDSGEVVHNIKLLLPVKEGERGLRQSDAVFAHIQNLKLISDEIQELELNNIKAIGFSACPRDQKGSYMPCFSVGESFAKMFASINKIAIYPFSHQAGHIRAAIYSSKVIPDKKFIAFHVSGGTTEILHVENDNGSFLIDIVGGSIDLHAGQAIDRIGVYMGLKFPCGKEMEQLAHENDKKIPSCKICVNGYSYNLSGLENLAIKLYDDTKDKFLVSAFVFDFIFKTISKITQNLLEEYKNYQIVYGGGVMSNSIIQAQLKNKFDNLYFAEPQFSTDNAAGIALLAREAYCKEK